MLLPSIIPRLLRLALPTLLVWLAGAQAAWAQVNPLAAGRGETVAKSYAMPYLLVGLVVILGLLLVLRPNHRAMLERIHEER